MSRNATNADIATAIGAGPGVCYVNAGVVQELTLGTNLSITGTTLNATGGGSGGVSSVFTRTGAVVAASGDYTVSQITGAAALAGAAFTGNVSGTGSFTANSGGVPFTIGGLVGSLSTYAAMYAAVTPTSANYFMQCDNNNVFFSAPGSSGTVVFQVAAGPYMTITNAGVAIVKGAYTSPLGNTELTIYQSTAGRAALRVQPTTTPTANYVEYQNSLAAVLSGVEKNGLPFTNSYATGSRPTVTQAGTTVFDSTLHYLVTWDGSVWRNGAGASV